MIINATTGQGFRGVLSYVEKEHEKNLTPEQRPEILEENNIYGNSQEKAQQMRFVADGNSHSSRPVLHVTVSFDEKEKLSQEQRDKVLNDVVKEFGATKENNQYQIVKHNDTNNEHYHIVINKVGFDGQNINTSYVKNKCQVVADKLEQKHDLQRVKGRTVVYDPTKEKGYRFTTKAERNQGLKAPRDRQRGVREKKTYIQQEVNKSLSNSKNLDELKSKLAAKGIETKYTHNKNGLSGVSFKYQNQAVKGSEVGFKAKEVSNRIEKNNYKTQEQADKEYNLKLQAFNKLMETKPKEVPSKVNLFRAEERKEALTYNKKLAEEKRNTQPPVREIVPNRELEQFKNTNMDKNLDQSLDKDQDQAQEKQKEQNRQLEKQKETSFERAERVRQQREEEKKNNQEQDKKRGRGI